MGWKLPNRAGRILQVRKGKSEGGSGLSDVNWYFGPQEEAHELSDYLRIQVWSTFLNLYVKSYILDKFENLLKHNKYTQEHIYCQGIFTNNTNLCGRDAG